VHDTSTTHRPVGTVISTSAVSLEQELEAHSRVVTESGTAYNLGLADEGPAEPPVRGVVAQLMLKGRREPLEALCSICQEMCVPGDVQRWDVTSCRHAFHEDCLRRWLTHCSREAALRDEETPAPTCPDCRRPLSSSRFRLYG